MLLIKVTQTTEIAARAKVLSRYKGIMGRYTPKVFLSPSLFVCVFRKVCE